MLLHLLNLIIYFFLHDIREVRSCDRNIKLPKTVFEILKVWLFFVWIKEFSFTLKKLNIINCQNNYYSQFYLYLLSLNRLKIFRILFILEQIPSHKTEYQQGGEKQCKHIQHVRESFDYISSSSPELFSFGEIYIKQNSHRTCVASSRLNTRYFERQINNDVYENQLK